MWQSGLGFDYTAALRLLSTAELTVVAGAGCLRPEGDSQVCGLRMSGRRGRIQVCGLATRIGEGYVVLPLSGSVSDLYPHACRLRAELIGLPGK
jgi:hypothetical protein